MNKINLINQITDKIALRFGYIKKDSIPAFQSGGWLFGGSGMVWSGSTSSPTELRDLACRCETLRAAISIIKESVSAVPFRLSLATESPSGRRAIARAELILSDPSEGKETFRSILRRLMEDLLILDAGALEIRHALDGLPRYIEYIPGDEIRLAAPEIPGTIPSPSYYRVSMGHVIGEYEYNELIYFVRDRQPSGYGLPPVEVLKNTAESIIKGQTYNREYFDRGTMVDGILNLPELNEDELKNFRRYWNAMIQGKRHVFAMTNARDAHWLQLRHTNKDMEFHQHLLWLSRLVCMVYGISPQEIGLTHDVNRATAQVMDRNTLRRGIRPWLMLIKERVEEEILRAIHPDLEFIWLGIDREDALTQAEIYRIATGGQAWMEPSEVRHELGLPV